MVDVAVTVLPMMPAVSLQMCVSLLLAQGAFLAVALQHDFAPFDSSSSARESLPSLRDILSTYVANLDTVSDSGEVTADSHSQPFFQSDAPAVEDSGHAPESPSHFLTEASQAEEPVDHYVDHGRKAAENLQLPPHWLDKLGDLMLKGLQAAVPQHFSQIAAAGDPLGVNRSARLVESTPQSLQSVGGQPVAIGDSLDLDNFLTLASRANSSADNIAGRAENYAVAQPAKDVVSTVGAAQHPLPDFEHFAPQSNWSFNPLQLFRGAASLVGSEEQVKQAQSRPSIWVHGYARSGSSTVMTMFSEAWPGERVFALFEPCHRKDELDEDWVGTSCGEQMRHYTACDFSFVRYLHGWDNRRSTTSDASEFSASAVMDACSRSSGLVFKTISHPFERLHVRKDVMPYLKQDPRMRFVFVVRDPRSIYASMLTTEPFRSRDFKKRHDVRVMTSICDSFASSVTVRHPRMFRLVLEDLLDSPIHHMRAVYKFLGVQFGEAQLAWAQRTLNATQCGQESGVSSHYRDCHTNWTATRSMQQWKHILNLTEQAIFLKSGTCRIVAAAYDYTLEFALPS